LKGGKDIGSRGEKGRFTKQVLEEERRLAGGIRSAFL